MKNGLYICLYIILISLFITLWGFYSAIRPTKIISTITPATFGISYENISFKTKDDILIRGWFIQSPNPQAKTLILMHGYPADKGNILPATIFLHQNYNLLYFDFRNLGQSEGYYSTVGKDETRDLQAAIQYLHSRNINEVGVWGFSLGGAVALMTAPLSPEIKVIVAESSYARLDWMIYDYYSIPLLKYPLGELTRFWAWIFLQSDIKKISPALAAEKLQIPVLLIHSKKDDVVSYKNAIMLEKALSNNPDLNVFILDNAQHGEQTKDLNKIIQQFYDKYFLPTHKKVNDRSVN